MVMYYLNAAVQGTVVDHAACFRMQIDAVGTVRKRLNAVAEFAFFRVVDFIDKGIAKATHLHSADVTHVEIGVQGGGGFELAVGFQFDFTGWWVQSRVSLLNKGLRGYTSANNFLCGKYGAGKVSRTSLVCITGC